ncbi:MAG: YdgA family protein [Candidatus Accumulibacter sp.]|nr:YdgA family protein [Accumulibacter sp.]
MKQKTVTIAAIVVVALAAAYPASSWFIGKRIEAMRGEIDAQIAEQSFFKLIRNDYERGLFDATSTITVEIPAGFPPGAPSVPAAAEESPDAPEASPAPISVTFKTAIRHGPLLDSGALGAGSAVTVIEFDEAIRQKVLEVFGGQPPLEIRTRYDFDGGGRFTIASPAFSVVLPDKTAERSATLSGDGLEITGEFTRGLEQYSLRGGAPRFEIAGMDGVRVMLTGLAIDADAQRLFPDEPLLYIGPQRFSLARLEVDPGAAPEALDDDDDEKELSKLALTDISCYVQTEASGEFIDSLARISAAGLRIGEQDYGPAAYDFSMKHLHARKLAAFNREYMALFADQAKTPWNKERLAPIQERIVAMLLDDPILSIDRIAFNTPDGEAKISASIRLIDARAEDFVRPLLLAAKIDAAAELALPVPLVTALAASDAEDETEALERSGMVEQVIASLVEQGFATADGGIFHSRLTFLKGQLLLNDKPFNPLAMALDLSR